jgi:guanylate kinase
MNSKTNQRTIKQIADKALETKKRIILVGKAASGKDYARKVLENEGYSYAVTFTSRPPRVGEVDGKDYRFIPKKVFETKIEQDFFYEYVPFNGWYYGTGREQLKHNNLFIMTPSGISKLALEDRVESFIILFDIPIEVRRERLEKRSDADTVDRRLAADEKDFESFHEYDYLITDPNFQ